MISRNAIGQTGTSCAKQDDRIPTRMAGSVELADRDATVDGMYLRIIVHANEHMGQLIAYARMTGVVPPWSKK